MIQPVPRREKSVPVSDLERVAECPASWPIPGPRLDKSDDSPSLRRSAVLRAAIVLGHREPDRDLVDIVAEAGSALDPVEREEVLTRVVTYFELVERNLQVQDDVRGEPWRSADGTVSASAAPTFLLDPGGDALAVRVRMGTYRGSDLEAEVMGRVLADARLAEVVLGGPDPEMVAIDITDDGQRSIRANQRLEELARLVDELPSPSARAARPGRSCFVCARLPYCGAFHFASGAAKVPNRSRLVIVTKSSLAGECERRMAWGRLFRFDADPGRGEGWGDDPTAAAREAAGGVGAAVHEVLAKLDRGEDAERVWAEVDGPLAARVAQLADRETASIRVREHDTAVEITSTEEQAGVCFLVKNSRGESVVVAMLARLDAAGSEGDRPCVVEYKTGGGGAELERDLYALILWFRTDPTSLDRSVVVHHHWLGREPGPHCERVVLDESMVAAALDRLRARAEQVAEWDPADALNPSPLVSWRAECSACDYALRCERHGGPRRAANPS